MFLKKIATFATISAVLTLGATAFNPAPASAAPKKAMTWTIKKAQVVSGKTYVLVGTDALSNPIQGDTLITERRSLLCISKNLKQYPNPGKLEPAPAITPGGANTYTWSNSKVLIIPNVLGSSLVSQADADKKCATVGQLIHGISGFRMAEFHDGTGNNPGWS